MYRVCWVAARCMCVVRIDLENMPDINGDSAANTRRWLNDGPTSLTMGHDWYNVGQILGLVEHWIRYTGPVQWITFSNSLTFIRHFSQFVLLVTYAWSSVFTSLRKILIGQVDQSCFWIMLMMHFLSIFTMPAVYSVINKLLANVLLFHFTNNFWCIVVNTTQVLYLRILFSIWTFYLFSGRAVALSCVYPPSLLFTVKNLNWYC